MITNSEGNQLNLGFSMHPSLMGSFNLPPPSQISPVFTISQVASENESREITFRTQYLNDSWKLPDPNVFTQGEGFRGMAYPLYATEIAYLDVTADYGQSLLKRGEVDWLDSPAWCLNAQVNVDSIDLVLP